MNFQILSDKEIHHNYERQGMPFYVGITTVQIQIQVSVAHQKTAYFMALISMPRTSMLRFSNANERHPG